VPNVVWLQKMVPNVCRTNDDLLFEGHTKRSSWYLWDKSYRQKSQNSFSGKFGEIRAKILRTPKYLLAPPPMDAPPMDAAPMDTPSIAMARLKSCIILFLLCFISFFIFAEQILRFYMRFTNLSATAFQSLGT